MTYFQSIFSNLEEKIQSITLNDECNGNFHEACERKTSASSSITSDSSGSTASTASASKFHLHKIPNGRNIENGVDKTKPKSQHNCNEPIYAVVNLKNKYENRAKKKNVGGETMNGIILRRGRPNSFHVNSGEYEEVRTSYDSFQEK